MNIATHVHLASELLNSTASIQQQTAVTDLNTMFMSIM
jgi:hypothetical protein